MGRKIALIGASGQLSFDLMRTWQKRHPADEITEWTHADIEVADSQSVESAFADRPLDIVVNTAAAHRVDDIEASPERAFAINAIGALNIARACSERDAVLVHISTDYVFGGDKVTPYVEEDLPDPVNIYGVSKAAGEMSIRIHASKHFIVRTSGLYGVAGVSSKGGNFVETMLRLASEDNPIRVVDDQTLTPTDTRSLAEQIIKLCETDAYGVLHATCAGECTWFEFASEIFKQAGLAPSLSRQSTKESGTKARRPAYSVLRNGSLERLGIDIMPDWRSALVDYLERTGRRPAQKQTVGTD